jgi:ketopantoate reductase
MQEPVAILGVGEIGGVMARGFLRAGHPVYPVTRSTDPARAAREYPEPALAVVAVAENDLHPTLESLPAAWRDKAGLIQNELLPRDWEHHGLPEPTVISVWFEKKPGTDVNVILSSPVHGPRAGMLVEALGAVDIPAHEVDTGDAMLFELVRKNAYILTTNIAGLVTGGTTGELWEHHRELAQTVADEILDIQAWLTGRELDRERVVAGMSEAMLADPEHKNTGRSAPGRLKRALGHADAAGLAVPKLREIAAEHLD